MTNSVLGRVGTIPNSSDAAYCTIGLFVPILYLGAAGGAPEQPVILFHYIPSGGGWDFDDTADCDDVGRASPALQVSRTPWVLYKGGAAGGVGNFDVAADFDDVARPSPALQVLWSSWILYKGGARPANSADP